MDRLIPWGEWVEEIRPCYYKGARENKPYGIELMLRLYVLQNLYTLSDEGTVAEGIDNRAFSEFCGVDSSNQVPDGDTLGRFRNLLIRNGIQEKLFAQVAGLLQERGLLLRSGCLGGEKREEAVLWNKRGKTAVLLRACLKSSNEDGDESKSKHLGRNKEFALTIFPKSAELVEPAK